ncbi:Ion channel [Ditylenchus destructor]|uniref:Ion channel n=1 Tax=Ditylenchus destructor TaxID=166010 RepID=A0AAD4R641_9BILA|nr:Ion channel [Ditylenchus destructor]
MALKVNSACELALRRSLFLLILIFGYLCVGTVVLRVCSYRPAFDKTRSGVLERLDFKRTELLNVLWAESIGRAEHDWLLLANQKLDAYEKSILQASRTSAGLSGILADEDDDEMFPQHINSLSQAFHHAFLLITTIGGVNVDGLTDSAKFFSIVYATVGIPLTLIYLGQCAKAITSLLPGQNIIFAAFGLLLATAIVLDIVEQHEDDMPFIDALLNVFLVASTIGGMDGARGELPPWLMYLVSIVSLATFITIQRYIESRIGTYEFAFTQKVGQIERVISGQRLDVVEEEDEVTKNHVFRDGQMDPNEDDSE